MNKVREDKIRGLLVRYMEGESTQEEQRVLKEFFRNAEDLPADLEPYAQMFAILEEKTQTLLHSRKIPVGRQSDCETLAKTALLKRRKRG